MLLQQCAGEFVIVGKHRIGAAFRCLQFSGVILSDLIDELLEQGVGEKSRGRVSLRRFHAGSDHSHDTEADIKDNGISRLCEGCEYSFGSERIHLMRCRGIEEAFAIAAAAAAITSSPAPEGASCNCWTIPA